MLCINSPIQTCKPENTPRPGHRPPIVILLTLAIALAAPTEAEEPGSPTLGAPRIIKTEWEAENLRLADLNGDGKADFLLVNNSRNILEFHFASPDQENGEPTFEKHQQTLEYAVRDITLADLNADGLTDIALAYQDRRIAVRYQRPDAEGFTPDRPLEAEAFRLAAIDLDGDGAIDLVAFDRDATYLFAGAGESEQTLDQNPTAKLRHAATPASALFLPDLDANGLRDFAYVDAQRRDHLMVRFQEAPRQWGLEYPIRATGIADLALAPAPGGGDWLVVLESMAQELRAYRLITNSVREQTTTLAGPGYLSFDPAGQAGQETIAVGDFDGDGRQDLAVATPGAARICVFVRDADGRLENRESPFLSDVKHILAIPVPGEADFIAALSGEDQTIGLAAWDHETGKLGVPNLLDYPYRPLALEAVDIDGSGRKDLLFLYREGEDAAAPLRLAVFRDLADAGGLTAQPETIEIPDTVRGEPVRLMGGDLDGDQRADLLLFTRYDPPILLLQKEPNQFSALATGEGTRKGLFGALTPDRLSLTPLEAGERIHLLAARGSFARAFLLNPDGELEMKAQFNGRDASSRIVAAATFQQSPGEQPWVVLLDAQTPCLTFYQPTPAGSYELANHQKLETARGEAMLIFDADADGHDDLLLYRGGPLALFQAKGETPEFENFWRQAPEDRDGRYARVNYGRPENAVFGQKPGEAGDPLDPFVLALEGTQNVLELLAPNAPENQPPGFGRVLRFKVFDDEKSIGSGRGASPRPEPREMLKGDVDGDGRKNLILLAHDNIIYYPHLPETGDGVDE